MSLVFALDNCLNRSFLGSAERVGSPTQTAGTGGVVMRLDWSAARLGVVGMGFALAACTGDGSDSGLSGMGTPDAGGMSDPPTDAPDAGDPAPTSDAAGDPYPLLGNVDNRHVWARFCESAPDDAPLPEDPRTLVQPGVNEGKAVVFNAYWRDCGNRAGLPLTCGEYRAQVKQGFLIGEGQGQVGTAHMFAASNESSIWTIPSFVYNNMWVSWGLDERPDNYDELIAERHGSPMTPFRNPYPLPGEDPNKTDGGSGQLPVVYTQVREADGTWTGNIGIKFCAFCHNGALDMDGDGPDTGAEFGGAGTIGDFHVAFRDFAGAGGLLYSAFSMLNIATNRGTGAIDQFQLGFVMFMNGDLGALPFDELISSSAIGTIKSPPWWNLANRPQKFHGAVLPTDSTRIDMAAYYPLIESITGGPGAEEAINWVDDNSVPFQLWAESLPAPRFPGEIDTALAEQGAILFHAKNLWAEGLDNPVEEPEGGNGSCASCHGVYSDRFAHDPAYLDSPDLKGIAGRVVPMTIVGTDPVYTKSGQSLKREDGSVNPAMLENVLLYCGFGEAGYIWDPVMLAPPLYGVWGNGPYFHNGSVPNIWGVLDSTSERPPMWRRVSTPKPAGQDNVVMGYDTDVHRAYDFDKLGWKYDEVLCGDQGTHPDQDCNPDDPSMPADATESFDPLYENFWFLWNLPLESRPPLTNQEIEDRKVYNTWRYSQGNQGHAFTDVLTDDERRAIIEYIKTL